MERKLGRNSSDAERQNLVGAVQKEFVPKVPVVYWFVMAAHRARQ